MTYKRKLIADGICKNCGASKDLHHAETNQCPSGGVEITFAEIQMGYMQEWERETFEDQGIATFVSEASQQIESLQQKLQAAEKQTAELQQEVERLKIALKQCKGLITWGTMDATHVFNQIDEIATEALNPH